MPDQGADNSNRPAPLKPSSETKPTQDGKAKKGKKDRPEPTTFGGKLWYNWVKPIGSVVLIVVLVRSTLIDWNDVPTGSMEPEIHVGDRIAVNRLAYALQFPLTGPEIGIPFTPIKTKNPLDGIPQIQWSSPDRGDIVTFWNPVTSVRMVKRIVAVPGDTIEVRNSVMIINGTSATYKELDALAEGLEVQTKYLVPSPLGGTQYERKDLLYRHETLLDQTRITQHIEERWHNNLHLVQSPVGGWLNVVDGNIEAELPNGQKQSIALSTYKERNPGARELKTRKGALLINDEQVSYNEFAELLLRPFQDGQVTELLDKIGLGVAGHELTIDGEAAFSEQFGLALNERLGKLTQSEREQLQGLLSSYSLLRNLLPTNFGPFTLGEREFFMVGDNRNNSSDSRHFGPVDQGEITGQAFAVAFSFTDNKMLALPPEPAWSRFFKDLD